MAWVGAVDGARADWEEWAWAQEGRSQTPLSSAQPRKAVATLRLGGLSWSWQLVPSQVWEVEAFASGKVDSRARGGGVTGKQDCPST